jgi:hypothetical protein
MESMKEIHDLEDFIDCLIQDASEAFEHQDRELLEETIKSYFKKQQEKSQNSIGRCEYCDSIDQATKKSPRKRYIFCPMCGRKRREEVNQFCCGIIMNKTWQHCPICGEKLSRGKET